MQNKIDVILAMFDREYQKQLNLNENWNGFQRQSRRQIDDARELLFKMIYAYQHGGEKNAN
mgnify:CR=1 FL=1|tara:strand:- start:421 stop:603 length:183 start_codon:yes stop_codon:yes gene_type:complete